MVTTATPVQVSMNSYAVAKRSDTKTKSGRQVPDDGFKGRQYQTDVRLHFYHLSLIIIH